MWRRGCWRSRVAGVSRTCPGRSSVWTWADLSWWWRLRVVVAGGAASFHPSSTHVTRSYDVARLVKRATVGVSAKEREMIQMTATAAAPAEIQLDICTPEGKTWLARLDGLDESFGFDREFVRAVSRDTSRSGRTGTATYLVEDGVYESNEGRRRLGRRYWLVDAGRSGRSSGKTPSTFPPRRRCGRWPPARPPGCSVSRSAQCAGGPSPASSWPPRTPAATGSSPSERKVANDHQDSHLRRTCRHRG